MPTRSLLPLLLLICAQVVLTSASGWTEEPPVTFAHQIAEIVHRKCGECHRRGGAAPFSLATYRELVDHAPEVLQQINQGSIQAVELLIQNGAQLNCCDSRGRTALHHATILDNLK